MALGMIRRKLAAFMRMDRVRRALLVEVLMALAIARLALLLFPFRHVAHHLGALAPPGEDVSTETEPGDARLAREIGWAVGRMAAHVPFKAVCLQQAIAAKLMLRRRGIRSALHFGIANGEGSGESLRAHAWLRDRVRQ